MNNRPSRIRRLSDFPYTNRIVVPRRNVEQPGLAGCRTANTSSWRPDCPDRFACPAAVGSMSACPHRAAALRRSLWPKSLWRTACRAGTGRWCDPAHRRSRCDWPTASLCAAALASRISASTGTCTESKSKSSCGVNWKYHFSLPVSASSATTQSLYRLSPARTSPFQSGPGLPMPQYVRFSRRIVGAGHPDRRAAVLPGIARPGFVARFARAGNGVEAPGFLAGVRRRRRR